MWLCIPEVLEGPEAYGWFSFQCTFQVCRQYKLLPCQEEAHSDKNHLTKPVGFWRGWKKGINYHWCCGAQIVRKGYLTKSLQALSALSGHSVFCKWTRQSLYVAKITLGACVHLPDFVALFSLTVFFFCFRSVTALWSSVDLFAVQNRKLSSCLRQGLSPRTSHCCGEKSGCVILGTTGLQD